MLIVKDHRNSEGKIIDADKVLENRIENKFWSISDKNPFRKKVAEGDRAIFFVSSRNGKHFAGDCVVTSTVKPLDRVRRGQLLGYPSITFEYCFEISGKLWERRVEVAEVIDEVSFIKNKDRWWSYFQGGMRPIGEDDFMTILGHS
ncbi:MAG: hypothetical protein RMJ06_02250 [Nitrososphaerota archaeon]|nr:hypothetical protein [Nitrososphaerota archaeon]